MGDTAQKDVYNNMQIESKSLSLMVLTLCYTNTMTIYTIWQNITVTRAKDIKKLPDDHLR